MVKYSKLLYMSEKTLADFMAEVVLTSHYLAEPQSHQKNPLHDAEVRALKIIYTNGPYSMHELAQAMHTSRPRSTQIVSSLIQKQLVERVKAGDKRMIYIVTTTKGTKTVRQLRIKYAKLAQAIEKKLGPKDSLELARLLEKISPIQQLPID